MSDFPKTNSPSDASHSTLQSLRQRIVMHVLLKVLDFAPSDGLVIGLQLYFGENLSIASLLKLTDEEFDCVVKCIHDDAHGFSTDASPTTSANFNFEDASTIPPGDF